MYSTYIYTLYLRLNHLGKKNCGAAGEISLFSDCSFRSCAPAGRCREPRHTSQTRLNSHILFPCGEYETEFIFSFYLLTYIPKNCFIKLVMSNFKILLFSLIFTALFQLIKHA